MLRLQKAYAPASLDGSVYSVSSRVSLDLPVLAVTAVTLCFGYNLPYVALHQIF